MTHAEPHDRTQPEPDAKDWVWVLTQECPECRARVGDFSPETLPGAVRKTLQVWPSALAAENATTRPAPTTWSATEYGAHVVDVLKLALTRTDLMLDHAHPTFANWDQDVTAIESKYETFTIDQVLTPMLQAASAYIEQLGALDAAAWARTGQRSNGSDFTILTFAQYVLHDLVHHAWDVSGLTAPELGLVAEQAASEKLGTQPPAQPAAVPARAKGPLGPASRVQLTVPVRWADLDAYGHVNNTDFLRLMEEARIMAFWTVPGHTARASKNVQVGGTASDTMTFIAGHRIEYRKQLEYRPQGVGIDLWVTKLGGASAELAYEIFSEDVPGQRVVYAVATSTMVFVAAATQRPRKLTDAERDAWGELLGAAPVFRG